MEKNCRANPQKLDLIYILGLAFERGDNPGTPANGWCNMPGALRWLNNMTQKCKRHWEIYYVTQEYFLC